MDTMMLPIRICFRSAWRGISSPGGVKRQKRGSVVDGCRAYQTSQQRGPSRGKEQAFFFFSSLHLDYVIK